MNKRELVAKLAGIGVQPSRKLGQNFLTDANMLDAMVRDAALEAGERILEIGPGTGVLTARLLSAGCRVVAVEYDHRLAAYLGKEFADSANLRLVEADACDLDYDLLMGDGPYRCIANLPYAVSSVLVAKLASQRNPPREMLVLLQREMADRLAARPRTKQYGALSVQVQTLYEAQILRRLPPEVFFPPPEVDSSFMRLKLREGADCSPQDRSALVSLVRHVFTQRRKKLAATLGRIHSREVVGDVFQEMRIGLDARPEELTPDQFAELARRLA